MKTIEYTLYWDGVMYNSYTSLEEAEHWLDNYRRYYSKSFFVLTKKEITETTLDI